MPATVMAELRGQRRAAVPPMEEDIDLPIPAMAELRGQRRAAVPPMEEDIDLPIPAMVKLRGQRRAIAVRAETYTVTNRSHLHVVASGLTIISGKSAAVSLEAMFPSLVIGGEKISLASPVTCISGVIVRLDTTLHAISIETDSYQQITIAPIDGERIKAVLLSGGFARSHLVSEQGAIFEDVDYLIVSNGEKIHFRSTNDGGLLRKEFFGSVTGYTWMAKRTSCTDVQIRIIPEKKV